MKQDDIDELRESANSDEQKSGLSRKICRTKSENEISGRSTSSSQVDRGVNHVLEKGAGTNRREGEPGR